MMCVLLQGREESVAAKKGKFIECKFFMGVDGAANWTISDNREDLEDGYTKIYSFVVSLEVPKNPFDSKIPSHLGKFTLES
jgi:hypothetical protein